MQWLVHFTVLAFSVMILAACVGSARPPDAPAPTSAAANPTPLPTVVQRVDWKTYRSQTYGFEFQHPEACGVVEHSDALSVGSRIELVVVDSGGLRLAEYVDQLVDEKTKAGGWMLESRQTELVGGNGAVRIEYRFGGTSRYGTALFIGRGAKIYVWQLTAGGFTCDEPEVFGDVFSSFRFTE